jgi:hypothetical protein
VTVTAPSKKRTAALAGLPPTQGGPSHPTIKEAMDRFWRDEAARRTVDVRNEVLRRIEVRSWSEQSDAHRAATMKALGSSVEGRIRFFDDWLWTYDPRNVALKLPARVPFRLRPRQRDLIRWLADRKAEQSSGLVEKSRDEGASFVVLGDMLADWLWTPGYAGVVGSRKQDLVDGLGDPKTLFWKLRQMLYSLPAWMLPEGFSRKTHDNYLRLVNPANGATITGEGGDNMGRGGRATVYVVDEWAFVSNPDSVNAAISQNSNVRIKVTTPNGPGNAAYRERFSGRMAVHTMDWRDNPAKNASVLAVNEAGELVEIHPWYEIQRASPEMTDATLAQEVDIDWTASVEGVVIPAKWVQAAVGFPLTAGSIRRGGLDVSEGGRDKTVYGSRAGGLVLRVKKITGASPNAKASDVEDLGRTDAIDALCYDRLGVGVGMTATVKAHEAQLPFRVAGVANNESPSRRQFEDQPKVPASERFHDQAAENWWALRLRFWKTYQRFSGLATAADYPDDECISLPRPPEQVERGRSDESDQAGELVAQLSQPTYVKTNTGKIKVDKKGEGEQSPDVAEALLYAFWEVVAPRKKKARKAKTVVFLNGAI